MSTFSSTLRNAAYCIYNEVHSFLPLEMLLFFKLATQNLRYGFEADSVYDSEEDTRILKDGFSIASRLKL